MKHFCTGLRKPVDNAEDNLADQAEKLKQEGNTLFKSGPEKYDAALEKYTTALELAGMQSTLPLNPPFFLPRRLVSPH